MYVFGTFNALFFHNNITVWDRYVLLVEQDYSKNGLFQKGRFLRRRLMQSKRAAGTFIGAVLLFFPQIVLRWKRIILTPEQRHGC